MLITCLFSTYLQHFLPDPLILDVQKMKLLNTQSKSTSGILVMESTNLGRLGVPHQIDEFNLIQTKVIDFWFRAIVSYGNLVTCYLHFWQISQQHWTKRHWQPSLCIVYFTGITRLQLIRSTEEEPSILLECIV